MRYPLAYFPENQHVLGLLDNVAELLMVEKVEEGPLQVLGNHRRARRGFQGSLEHFGEHAEGYLHGVGQQEVPDFQSVLRRNALVSSPCMSALS